ncbi:MAG TPA: addiction module protein [Candidatus Binatia bacterium]|nr:addiction module protein [Candidatus Binatia bacterium]
MRQEAAEILKRALALPSAERADVAAVLMNSLDPAENAAVEAAWSDEIARRIEEVDSGRARTIPWEEVCRRVAAKIKNGR